MASRKWKFSKRHRVGTSYRRGRKDRKRQRDYERFIASAAWRRIRKAKLRSVEYLCEDCPKNHPTLATQVHHQNYTRFGGQEWMLDLRALCEACHKRAHRVMKQHRGLWFSSRVAAEHAMTQFGIDTRAQILASYDHH